MKNLKTSGWKQKVAEKSENGWKQKSCWKIFKPVVKSKKVAEKSENQRLKAKTLFKKNFISLVENVNEKVWLNKL